MRLLCVLVGAKPSATPATIDADSSIKRLKEMIKMANSDRIRCKADELKLFPAKTDKGRRWLESSDDDVRKLEKGEKTDRMMLCVINATSFRERTAFDDSCSMENKCLSNLTVKSMYSQSYLNQNWPNIHYIASHTSASEPINGSMIDSNPLRFFRMTDFSPLAHTEDKFKTVMERDSYATIFTHLMGEVAKSFKVDTGRSRPEPKASADLIHEGDSSPLTGWRRISILFAFPDLEGLSDYAKVAPFKLCLPVWTLQELQSYNSVLGDRFKVPNDVLVSRYDKFGGVPKHIFSRAQRGNKEELNKAIDSINASEIIAFVKGHGHVSHRDCSQWILQMVPEERFFERFLPGLCVQVCCQAGY